MHRLSFGFVLGYHGCDEAVGLKLLNGRPFKQSTNEYDWLGPGIYFWEANPVRGLKFAKEASKRPASKIKKPFVVGAVIDLGYCLDLTTHGGIETVRQGHNSLLQSVSASSSRLPENGPSLLKRHLDCAVIRRVHSIVETSKLPRFDTVRGIFTEGRPIYPTAGFDEKTHIQIAVCNPDCIKGVFRVPKNHLALPVGA
ncbi:MAG: hypothetical protein K2P94_17490 [Rhodospirillaceae bacterium]|nr:hypothetical protein [Rhodospirillaceae bacterium]